MQKGYLKIDNIKIVNSLIEIDRNCKDKLGINLECTGRVGKPKNSLDNTLLLNIVFDISSAESDELIIQLEADVFFSYDEKPENFDWMVEKECMPMAQKEVLNKLDNILVELGYSKLNFAENI